MKRLSVFNRIASSAIFLFLLISCERDEKQPVACFDYYPTSDIKTGDEITFTNCSTDAISYEWYFGDGTTSVAKDPKHEFDEGGDYDVTLIVTNKTLKDQTTQTITVKSSSLTGTWNKTFYIGDSRYDGTLVLVQSGNNLTGSFVFSDGSGFTNLLSSSHVSGNTVTIEWILDDSYTCIFPGSINAAFTYMNGTWSSIGVEMGAWSATKTLKSEDLRIIQNSQISEKERFVNSLINN